MSWDTSWDIDKYKPELESEQHWKLRKEFMLAHKDKFPEERLVCLSQVFFNIKHLGCKYPGKLMDLVEKLSKNIGAEHREELKTTSQRTLVKASNAARAKMKGLNCSAENVLSLEPEVKRQKLEIKEEDEEEEADCQILENVNDSGQCECTYGTLDNVQETNVASGERSNVTPLATQSDNNNNHVVNEARSEKPSSEREILTLPGPGRNLALHLSEDKHPNSTLSQPAHEWNKPCQIRIKKENGMWHGSVIFDGVELIKCVHKNEEIVTRAAGQLAVDKLMQLYYALKIEMPFYEENEQGVQQVGSETIHEDNDSTNVAKENEGTQPIVVMSSQEENAIDIADGVQQTLLTSSRNEDTIGSETVHEDNDNTDIAKENEDTQPTVDVPSPEENTIGTVDSVEQKSLDSSRNDGTKICVPNRNNSKQGTENTVLPLNDSNVGMKMLKGMGWSGGGLGKYRQGITEPINPKGLMNSRAGFGSKANAFQPKGKRNGNIGGGTAVGDRNQGRLEDRPMKRSLLGDYRHSRDFYNRGIHNNWRMTQPLPWNYGYPRDFYDQGIYRDRFGFEPLMRDYRYCRNFNDQGICEDQSVVRRLMWDYKYSRGFNYPYIRRDRFMLKRPAPWTYSFSRGYSYQGMYDNRSILKRPMWDYRYSRDFGDEGVREDRFMSKRPRWDYTYSRDFNDPGVREDWFMSNHPRWDYTYSRDFNDPGIREDRSLLKHPTWAYRYSRNYA